MDEDAPPSLRWRIASWTIAAVILASVLYVAAEGPISWYLGHRGRTPDWHWDYQQPIVRLYDADPRFALCLEAYLRWWLNVPAPRFLKRARLREEIADLKAGIRQTQIEDVQTWNQRQLRHSDHRKQIDALIQTSPIPQQTLREALREINKDKFNYYGYRMRCSSPDDLIQLLNTRLQAAEQRLRQFDAQ